MAAGIQVESISETEFRMTVREGGSQTTHTVTLTGDYYEKLTGGDSTKEALLRESFVFLLEREPKDSILSQFELPVIGRYFPEYERDIQKRFTG
jgi:hypothetical protein